MRTFAAQGGILKLWATKLRAQSLRIPPEVGPGDSPRPDRRLVLRLVLGGAMAGATGSLAGCRIVLEDDVAEVPVLPLPTREPIPAEEPLLWLLRDCHQLADTTVAEAALYAEQRAVLRTALYRAGVPIGTIDAALTEATAPTETAEPTFTSPRGPAAALRRLPDLVECGGGLYPLVIAILAQRWATVDLSGALIPVQAAVEDPDHSWPEPERAVAFVQVTDPSRYGFQVVTAQARDETREAALAALARIDLLRREQEARSGGTAPGPQIGYPLPLRVDSEESAHELATAVLTDLVDGYAALLSTMTNSDRQQTAPDLVRWLGTVAALGTGFGVALTAFPGMSTPQSADPTTEPTESP